MKFKYLFGPIASRRLNLSLGIDLLPYKTCTLNCVYCECGRTDNLTIERSEFVPTADVIDELDQYLKENPPLDYITFAGSGEPTLHTGIGEIVKFLKDKYPQYKVALLTNGTLFYEEELIHEVALFDLIIPSVDSVTKIGFLKLNRPSPKLSLDSVISGLKRLSTSFKGDLWLEIFIVPGINDSTEEIAALSKLAWELNPTKVQLNTLDRPGTEEWVEKMEGEKLIQMATLFPNVEIIAKGVVSQGVKIEAGHLLDSIIATIKRRPVTSEDLVSTLDVNRNEINKALYYLLEKGDIVSENRSRGLFYKENQSK
jgi:wyosine [tRNA(Phe)-imidazoG37] synthetase (radical SAM superfamily)